MHREPDFHGGGADGYLDNVHLVTREATRDDAHYLDAGLEQFSERSRYYRFFSAMPRLPESLRQQLIDIDGVRHGAVLVLDADAGSPDSNEGLPVGIARWITNSAGEAHLSVAVTDDYQGKGAGTALLRALAELARSRGLAHLHADVLADNAAMKATLHKFGAQLVPNGDASIVTYDWDLSAQVDR